MVVFPEKEKSVEIKEGSVKKKKSARQGGRNDGRIKKRGGIRIPLS